MPTRSAPLPSNTNARSGDAPANLNPLPSAAANTPASKPDVAMPDVQGTQDTREVAIDKVGVKDVTYPIRLRTPPALIAAGEPDHQSTVAKINMYVSLPREKKGTHMSRFLEVLNEHDLAGGGLTPSDVGAVTKKIRLRLQASEAHFAASFTYFIKKLAPITKQPGLMDYQVAFECSSREEPPGSGVEVQDFIMAVKAPAKSLCPCSKEISRYGAHNQRCLIEARVRFTGDLWIEELAKILESSASAEVFAVLKRPDEKYVTETAYDNPKFVEDIIRDLALALNRDERITWYHISSENFESIHNHNAYAEITRDKRDGAGRCPEERSVLPGPAPSSPVSAPASPPKARP
ncbi:GTP cyclohydrolase FolE2 [soil metagenome]